MTQYLSKDQLLHFEAMLLAQKAVLDTKGVQDIDAMMQDDDRGGDSIDLTTVEQRKSTQLRLKDRELRRLFEINEALSRIRDGTYGLCELCDEEIPLPRLNANPTAKLCIECQEEIEAEKQRHKRRPGLLDDPDRF